jgi:hypothetical protein
MSTPAQNVSENGQRVKVAAAGAGGCAHDLRNSGLFDKDADDALLGLEDPGDAEERSRLGEDSVLSWRTGMKRS